MFARNSSMTSRTGGQPVDTVVPLHSHALQVAQHFSVGWLTPLRQFIEKRGGIALSLVRPLRAIDKTTRLSIAFHRRAGSASPRKKLAWNCRVVSTSPQRIEATDSTLLWFVASRKHAFVSSQLRSGAKYHSSGTISSKNTTMQNGESSSDTDVWNKSGRRRRSQKCCWARFQTCVIV